MSIDTVRVTQISKQTVDGGARQSIGWATGSWHVGRGQCSTIEDRPGKSSRHLLRREDAELTVDEQQLRKPAGSSQERSASASFDQFTPQQVVDTAVERHGDDMILSRTIAG